MIQGLVRKLSEMLGGLEVELRYRGSEYEDLRSRNEPWEVHVDLGRTTEHVGGGQSPRAALKDAMGEVRSLVLRWRSQETEGSA